MPVRAFLAHQNDLLDLALQILGALDPVTNEQLREELRKLLEEQN